MPYILPFLLIAIGGGFEHEQAQHAENFTGENLRFRIALWFSAYASWASRMTILAYVGLKLSWVAAIAMFIGGMLASGVIAGALSVFSKRVAGTMAEVYVSLLAFVIWPVCFLAAYLSLPRVG